MEYIDPSKISFVSGRLYGLCGTVRYDIPHELRIELKNLGAMLNNQEVKTTD